MCSLNYFSCNFLYIVQIDGLRLDFERPFCRDQRDKNLSRTIGRDDVMGVFVSTLLSALNLSEYRLVKCQLAMVRLHSVAECCENFYSLLKIGMREGYYRPYIVAIKPHESTNDKIQTEL